MSFWLNLVFESSNFSWFIFSYFLDERVWNYTFIFVDADLHYGPAIHWEFLYNNIPKFIKECYEKNCMVVIFTYQTKPWKCDQIKQALSPERLENGKFLKIARKIRRSPQIRVLFVEFLHLLRKMVKSASKKRY